MSSSPHEQRELARDVAYLTALVLIQTKGDPTDAVVYLEQLRERSYLIGDTGFEKDVVDDVQRGIALAADTYEQI